MRDHHEGSQAMIIVMKSGASVKDVSAVLKQIEANGFGPRAIRYASSKRPSAIART